MPRPDGGDRAEPAVAAVRRPGHRRGPQPPARRRPPRRPRHAQPRRAVITGSSTSHVFVVPKHWSKVKKYVLHSAAVTAGAKKSKPY